MTQPEQPPQGQADQLPAHQRPLSFMQTLGAVFWSFFGVRKSKDHQADYVRLNPVHLIIAGVLGAVIFIVVLLLIVKWVVASSATP